MKTKVFLVLLCAGMFFAGCKKEGCTDATAANYYDQANLDDGSCTYTYTCCYYDENGMKQASPGLECLTSDMSPEDKQITEDNANSSLTIIGWSYKCE